MIETKPVLLDLFCGAGGCARGYQMAGFYVVGVDTKPQPRYAGDIFVWADALEVMSVLLNGGNIADRAGNVYRLETFAAIHSSPPCQGYSRETPEAYKSNHPRMIGKVRSLLQATGKPYIIENVEDARRYMENPIKLCGSMFGLDVWRHRYFEIWPNTWWLTPSCNHSNIPVLITGTPRRKGHKRADPPVALKRQAIGIDWMVTTELDEAIPPAFTHWVGERLMESLQVTS